MKYHANFSTLAAFAAFAAAPAAGAESDAADGPYLGIGYVHVDHEGGTARTAGVSASLGDFSTQGFILRGGFSLGELVDLEADYGQTSGDFAAAATGFGRSISIGGDIDYRAWGVNLLLNLQTGAVIEPFLRVGHRWIEAEASVVTDDFEEAVFGAGLRGDVGGGLFLRFDYEWIDEESRGWMVGLEFKF